MDAVTAQAPENRTAAALLAEEQQTIGRSSTVAKQI